MKKKLNVIDRRNEKSNAYASNCDFPIHNRSTVIQLLKKNLSGNQQNTNAENLIQEISDEYRHLPTLFLMAI